MTTVTVPTWWMVISAIFFAVVIIWSLGVSIALVFLIWKVLPLLRETQIQVKRISAQVQTIGARVSHTAEVVHAQTRNLIGNADSAGEVVTRQARSVGGAVTVAMMASRVMGFVRKMF